MTLYYIELVKCVPNEAQLRPQFRSRRIERRLWSLKHRSFGENVVAYAKRISKDLTGTQNTCFALF